MIITPDKLKQHFKVSITYQTPQENLLTTPILLPSTEPATPQISITLSATDFPIFSSPPVKARYIAAVYVGGKDTGTAGGTIYYRLLKNGTSIANPSFFIGATHYFTISAFFKDVSPGDVLEISLWSTNTSIGYDYTAYQVQVTRPWFWSDKQKALSYSLFNIQAQPALQLGTPQGTVWESIILNSILEDGNWERAYMNAFSTSLFLPLEQRVDETGLFCAGYGDDYFGFINWYGLESATNRPYYCRNFLPTEIEVFEYGF